MARRLGSWNGMLMEPGLWFLAAAIVCGITAGILLGTKAQ